MFNHRLALVVNDVAPAEVEIPYNLTDKLVRRHDINGHDGFEKNGTGFSACRIEAHGSGCLKGQCR